MLILRGSLQTERNKCYEMSVGLYGGEIEGRGPYTAGSSLHYHYTLGDGYGNDPDSELGTTLSFADTIYAPKNTSG